LLNDWIEENILHLQKICQSVSKNNDSSDLCQICLEQLLKSKTINNVPDEQKLYFFARLVRNNFNSKTSRYHKVYRKTNFVELGSNMDISNEDYTDSVLTIEWVLEEIEKIKQYDWYLGQITLHYFAEDCNLTRLSKKIGIPINNLSRDIRKIKIILNDKLQEKLKE
jgi:excinuclease UvrABC helicase subunit UvrB